MKQKFSDYAGEMFDRLPDAIAVADQQRIIQEVNPAFLELFRYSEEEIVGQSTAVLYADPEDFNQQGQSRFNAAASADSSEYIMRYQTADGVVFHGATIGVPLTNGGDKHVGFMGSIRDVTDRVLRQQGMSAILELAASASDPDYKLRELLRLGCEHFGLDLGIISAVDGDRYEVLRVFDPTGEIQAGQVFAVGESFTRDVLNSAAPPGVSRCAGDRGRAASLLSECRHFGIYRRARGAGRQGHRHDQFFIGEAATAFHPFRFRHHASDRRQGGA